MRAMIVPAAALLVQLLPTLAQPATAQAVLTSPEAVRECLCLRQATEFRNAEMSVARGAMENAQTELSRIQAEVQRRRPLVNPDDANALAEFTTLVQSEEPARRALNDDKVPDYNRAVQDYSAAVQAFNRQCGGKSYDPVVQQQVQASLLCPR